MITRGYYLGEIIDDFSALAGQVKMRNTLGFTDLSVYAENFLRDVLNILLDINLVNLNSERSNEPGLDLGDKKEKIAFQITASATTQKVNETLTKIAAQQAKEYDRLIVLGMNKRQRSYSLDSALMKQYSFESKNIWDLDTLARKAISLELDSLQRLYRLVRSDSARLKVELELPDENGNYPTNGFDLWEKRIKPKVGNGSNYIKYWQEQTNKKLDKNETKQLASELNNFGKILSKLPRLTREFLAMFYERREKGKSKRFRDGPGHLLLAKVQREYRGDDLKGELDILQHANLISIDGEDPDYYGPTEIGLLIPGDSEELSSLFIDFVAEKKLNFRKVIGEIDLSSF